MHKSLLRFIKAERKVSERIGSRGRLAGGIKNAIWPLTDDPRSVGTNRVATDGLDRFLELKTFA